MPERVLSCVLLADRHHGLAEGVRDLLETSFSSVVMVADVTSLLEIAGRLRPDVAILDLSLAQGGSLNWLRAFRERHPDLKIIVVGAHGDTTMRRTVLNAGADEFVLKASIAVDLLPAVDRARGLPKEAVDAEAAAVLRGGVIDETRRGEGEGS